MMSRKEFIQSQGATCRNWTWSWSFVNHKERFVIFGAWDRYTRGGIALILNSGWSKSARGRKQPAFGQSREHIRLVEEDGYSLKTFPIEYSDAKRDEDGRGPAAIGDFTPKLESRNLIRVGDMWYASDGKVSVVFPEEVDAAETFVEGASKTISVNIFERNPLARSKCLAHHGYKCAVCSFDFEEFYGEIGRGFIHVHHLTPISGVSRAYELDPIKDLVPICPNCHAMVHRTRPILTVNQLKEHLSARRS